MTIQQSKDYLTNRTGWMIDETTFQALDAEKCIWIARVTTTHNKRHYEEAKKRAEELGPGLKIELPSPEERSFTVLVRGSDHLQIANECLPGLLDWLLKQAK